MIVIPSKAKEIICPFITDSETVINCEGDKCMAWTITDVNVIQNKPIDNDNVIELKPIEFKGTCGRLRTP